MSLRSSPVGRFSKTLRSRKIRRSSGTLMVIFVPQGLLGFLKRRLNP